MMASTTGDPHNGVTQHPVQPDSHMDSADNSASLHNNGLECAARSNGGSIQSAGKATNYLDLVEGKQTLHKTEYDINNKGLFVMVRNTAFNYVHNDHDWNNEPKLNYEADELTLLETFKLDENDSNVVLGHNLTSRDPDGESEFDAFMNELVSEKKDAPKCGFLMFVLMSHGLKDGKFLLAEEGRSEPCCSDSPRHTHSGKENCHVRHITKDIVSRVQGSSRFTNIPKIFIIQTCRGVRMDAVDKREKKAAPPRPAPSLADDYIPVGSDTFVLYACYEDHLSWVNDGGSFLIKYFCEALNDLRRGIRQSEIFFGELTNALVGDGGRADGGEDMEQRYDSAVSLKRLNDYVVRERGWDKLLLCPESLTGGWIEGVCQKTIAKITNLLVRLRVVDENGKVFPGETKYDKQQPHISCTLRFKLSAIKLLRTQWGDDL